MYICIHVYILLKFWCNNNNLFYQCLNHTLILKERGDWHKCNIACIKQICALSQLEYQVLTDNWEGGVVLKTHQGTEAVLMVWIQWLEFLAPSLICGASTDYHWATLRLAEYQVGVFVLVKADIVHMGASCSCLSFLFVNVLIVLWVQGTCLELSITSNEIKFF